MWYPKCNPMTQDGLAWSLGPDRAPLFWRLDFYECNLKPHFCFALLATSDIDLQWADITRNSQATSSFFFFFLTHYTIKPVFYYPTFVQLIFGTNYSTLHWFLLNFILQKYPVIPVYSASLQFIRIGSCLQNLLNDLCIKLKTLHFHREKLGLSQKLDAWQKTNVS